MDNSPAPVHQLTSGLLDLLALLGGHPLVGEGDHVIESLALHLREVSRQLPIPRGVRRLHRKVL